mmetsp:Transcript_19566/g.65724  ORF Transcript_19566/g.65724 Transcript_19566/m.65724 type:complete len:301 (-) Transcript_19566:2053-2955(-)
MASRAASALTRARQLLAGHETLIGHWHCSGSALLAETITAGADYDVLVVDMQHGLIEPACAASVMASTRGAAPFVRLKDCSPAHIHHCLDAGAMGIIAPLINTADDARAMVRESRSPPLGTRSFGPVRAGLLSPNYFEEADAAVMRWAMIETAPALANAAEIAAVEGVDGLFIGPNDLSLALGVPPSSAPTDPRVVEGAWLRGAVGAGWRPSFPLRAPPLTPPHPHAHPPALAAIRKAAHSAGKYCGIFCVEGSVALRMKQEGFDFVITCTDLGIAGVAAKRELDVVRGTAGAKGAKGGY